MEAAPGTGGRTTRPLWSLAALVCGAFAVAAVVNTAVERVLGMEDRRGDRAFWIWIAVQATIGALVGIGVRAWVHRRARRHPAHAPAVGENAGPGRAGWRVLGVALAVGATVATVVFGALSAIDGGPFTGASYAAGWSVSAAGAALSIWLCDVLTGRQAAAWIEGEPPGPPKDVPTALLRAREYVTGVRVAPRTTRWVWVVRHTR